MAEQDNTGSGSGQTGYRVQVAAVTGQNMYRIKRVAGVTPTCLSGPG
jgi:hypothetical protein